MEPFNLPPGFRFHPTDEELVIHYLRPKVNGRAIEFDLIQEVDLYNFEPWDLPYKSLLGGSESEWYFFSHRDKKYSKGPRSNRSTKHGYWKGTGKDRFVQSRSKKVASKKTLVFYEGRAPHGKKTDWVMYEYQLEDDMGKEAVVLCHVIKKNNLHSSPAEDSRAIFPVQDVGDLPLLSEGCSARDEQVAENLLAVTAPISPDVTNLLDPQVPESIQELEYFLGLQDFTVRNEDMNVGSITADVKYLQMENFDPALLMRDEGSFLSGAAARTDIHGDKEDKVIEELYNSLSLVLPLTEEDVKDCNHAEQNISRTELQLYDAPGVTSSWFQQALITDFPEQSTLEELLQLSQHGADVARSGDIADASDYGAAPVSLADFDALLSDCDGSPADLHRRQFLQTDCVDTKFNVVNFPHCTEKNSALIEPRLQSYPENPQSAVYSGITDAVPLTNAPLLSSQIIPKVGSSQDPTDSSQHRPISVFAKILDSMSVLPASAAEFPSSHRDFLSTVRPHSMIQEVPGSRPAKVAFPTSCKMFVDTRGSSAKACDTNPRISISTSRNQKRTSDLSFSIAVLVGALLAMSWFLLWRKAWGLARHLCSLLAIILFFIIGLALYFNG